MSGLPIDFQTLFALAPNAYMVLDRELKFVAANQAYLRVVGSRLEDVLGHHVFEAFPNDPDDPANRNVARLRESFQRVFATGKPDELALIAYSVPTVTERGTELQEKYWSATHTPIPDASGRVAFILQHTVDITELHRARLKGSSAASAGVEADVLRRAESVENASIAIDLERQHLRRLFDQAPGFVCFLRGAQHVFEIANPAYYQLVGHRDILGRSVRDALPELEGQGFYELLDGVFTTAKSFSGRNMRVHLQRTPGASLEESFVDLVYQPIIAPDGQVSGIFVSGYDRTAQEQARADRERLAAIVEQSSDWVGACDVTGQLTYLNEAGQKMLGLSAEKIASTPGASFFLPEDLPFVEQVIWPAVSQHDRWEGDFRFRHFQTGEAIPIHYNVFTIRDPVTRELRGVASVSRDTRERAALVGAQLAAESAHRFLADSIPEQVWTAAPDGQLNYVNQRVTNYFGRTYDEMIGQGWQGVVHPEDLEAVLPRWVHSLKTGEPYEVEFRLKRFSDQTYRWHIARALPLRDPAGQIVKWYGSNTDIDEQKRTVRERDRAILALQASNKELDRFAYVASHDLKTPLRGIANLAEWVEEDLEATLTDESRTHLRLLRGRVTRMHSLIEGVLSYARSGRTTEPGRDVDVGKLVSEVIELSAPPAGITFQVTPSLPTLRTAVVPLQQVFMNLIGNAVKHAARGDARVTIEAEPLGAFYRFTVGDNGQGIDPRFHERIWELFQTLEARDRVEGTGIGLSVVKKIVESRGGTVSLESSVGAGARFSFTWPINPET